MSSQFQRLVCSVQSAKITMKSLETRVTENQSSTVREKKLDEGGLGPTHQSSPKSAQRLRGGERADGKEEEVSPSSLALSLPIVDLLSHDYNYLLPLVLLHTG